MRSTGFPSTVMVMVPRLSSLAPTTMYLSRNVLSYPCTKPITLRDVKVSPDSVRFDFRFGRSMTAEEKQAVEDLINTWIAADMPVLHD